MPTNPTNPTSPTRTAADRPTARSIGALRPTLSSHDYCSDEVYRLDQQRIFHRGWMYVCHVDGLHPGTHRAIDLAGRSVLVARHLDGGVHAFANVCRHRGAELCDTAIGDARRGSIRCGYHAWTYALDGSLAATPRVDDGFDRSQYGLWRHHAQIHNGMVFVSVAEHPPALHDWLTAHAPALLGFDRLPVASYRIARRTVADVAANWKIIIENYAECLHCAVVHPELTRVIPLYRTGNVVDPHHPDAAVTLAPGAVALTADGHTDAPLLPGFDEPPSYDGSAVFPNMFFDLGPTSLALTAIFPLGPQRCRVVGEYLFAAEAFEQPGFDPAPEVEFNELIGAQDYAVCEMVQRGVSSPSFSTGGLTGKDEYVAEFVARYLATRDGTDISPADRPDARQHAAG